MSNFPITQQELIEDLFSRRFSNNFSWAIPEIDKCGGLMTPGRMAILGGPHGSGKTTYVTEVAKHNSLDKPTMLVPLEMGSDFTIMTLACNIFNSKRTKEMQVLGYGELEEGYLYQRPEGDKELFKECVSSVYNDFPGLHIGTPEDLTFDSLCEMISNKRAEGIKFFIIDHLHQLSLGEEDNETKFYSMVAKGLKELAQDLNVALLCIVQLTKAANSSQGILDLSAFKGTSEFTSNAHRVAVIKKVDFKPLAKSEAKVFISATELRKETMTEEFVIDHYEDQFKEKTRHIREVVFLKTRGRDGGVTTIKMKRGQFEFLKPGTYNYKVDFNPL